MNNGQTRWVVMTDVDAIQAWLFASVRLREIAGASRLLVEHDQRLAELARDWEGQSLFSAGGSGRFKFAAREQALKFAAAAQRQLVKHTVSARLSVSEPQEFVESESGGFVQAMARAAASVELGKRLGHAEGESADCAFARRCQSCGLEPAREQVVAPERRWLGPACLRKYAARDRVSWPIEYGLSIEPLRLSQTFDEIAGSSGDGAAADVAIVAGDVNGVGERLRELQDENEYLRFSAGLHSAVRTALSSALAAVVESARREVREDDPASYKLPVELLYTGGDDVLVACRGDLALPFAKRLVTTFVQSAREGVTQWTPVPLGMSAAVVLSRVGFPFRVAQALAEELLRAAKREARIEGWIDGAVDFVRVTEAFADPAAVLGDRALVSPDPEQSVALHLTARPFRASDSGERSIGGFEAACRALSAAFPRNKVVGLRELCSASRYLDPGDTCVEQTVEEAQQQFEVELMTWSDRLRRDPVMMECWREACKHVGAPAEGLWKRGTAWRTPLGDLAEGMKLWGI